ncbi:MAG: PIN domain-containing protein [Candidatus Binatia bacterium]
MRIFLDTNVLISAYRARGLCADLLELILTDPDCELLTGEVNLAELKRILRNRFKVSKAVVEAVEQELKEQTIIPKPSRPSPLPIRDPDDRWVLASAKKRRIYSSPATRTFWILRIKQALRL